MDTVVTNTMITSVDVGYEDHGILTLMVSFEGGNLPLYSMGQEDKLLGAHIKALLDTFGARRLDDLKGKPARVERDGGMWERIGHFMKDSWYSPRQIVQVEEE